MTRSRPMTLLAGAAVIPLAALAAAGCGGGGGANASAKPPKTTTIARVAAVRVANSRLGKILVDSHGHTLYLFKKDSGSKSACVGACATFWPPLRTNGKPTVGSGASAALIGACATPVTRGLPSWMSLICRAASHVGDVGASSSREASTTGEDGPPTGVVTTAAAALAGLADRKSVV